MNVTVPIDGIEENEFRRDIETLLREGRCDEAAVRIRPLLARVSGEGNVLPHRFLTIEPSDIVLEGWNALGAKLEAYDREAHPITALGIDLAEPDRRDAGTAPDGALAPRIETAFYCDAAYPFSQCDRDDLLDGYSSYGTEWQGSAEYVDDTLSLPCLADLYGPVHALGRDDPSGLPATPAEQEAYVIGACYLSVLIHQAVRAAIASPGLPRPLAVLVGSDEIYPHFDAPVLPFEESVAPVPAKPARAAKIQALPPLDIAVELAPLPANDLPETPFDDPEPAREETRFPVFDEPEPVARTPEPVVQPDPQPVMEASVAEPDSVESDDAAWDEVEIEADTTASLAAMPAKPSPSPSIRARDGSIAHGPEGDVATLDRDEMSGSQLRKRVSDAERAEAPARPRGFFARLFGLK